MWTLLSRVPQRLRNAASYLAQSIPAAQYDGLLGPPMRLLQTRLQAKNIGEKVHKAAGLIGLGSPDEVYRVLVSLWQQPDHVVLDGAEPATPLTSGNAAGHIAEPVRRMMYLDLQGYLPDDILVKVDRASMAVGLEARVPLLDHRLVEFTWTLPLALLRRDGQSKWPLRQVLDRYIPRKLTERPKMGFGVPIDSWLRGPLKDWAENLLDERRLACEGFFNPGPIRAAWSAHQEGRSSLHYQLWGVLMFQAWREAQGPAAYRPTMQAALARG
jgi:asparagine synthase (glutamine-hydrolysing)